MRFSLTSTNPDPNSIEEVMNVAASSPHDGTNDKCQFLAGWGIYTLGGWGGGSTYGEGRIFI